MDLEHLLRACWRRRYRLVATIVIVGALVVGVGSVLLKTKYAATTDVQVVPSANLDTSQGSTYSLQPDRYVATQAAIVLSHTSIQRVADQVKLPIQQVQRMVTASQVGKSDILAVTATSADGQEAAAVSSALANAYVNSITATAIGQYNLQISAIDQQLASVDQLIGAVQQKIAALGTGGQPGALQAQLQQLASQELALNNNREQLVAQENSNPTNTRVISTGLPHVTGTTKKKLALYGLALGIGLAVSQVAITAGPGRTLESLETAEEFGGVPVIGTASAATPWLERARRARDVSNLRVASELSMIIQLKGPVAVVPVGNQRRISHAMDILAELIDSAHVARDGAEHAGASSETALMPVSQAPDLSVVPLMSVLDGSATGGAVVFAVELAKVRPAELSDLVVALRSTLAELIGIIGVR